MSKRTKLSLVTVAEIPAEENKVAKVKKEKVKAIYTHRLKGYLTPTSMGHKRLSDKDSDNARNISDKWEGILSETVIEDGCHYALSDSQITLDRATKKAKFSSESSLDNYSIVDFWQAIPSSLLMYRLLGLWKAHVMSFGPDGYKSIWCIQIRHKESGAILSFGEHKAGASFSLETRTQKCPAELKKDLLELITLLSGDKCPHPYDGVVSGSVA